MDAPNTQHSRVSARVATCVAAAVVVSLLALAGTARADTVTVTDLTADHAHDPLGIEDPAPALSWQLRSGRRGTAQTAYQIQVAPRAADLVAGEHLIWDSGKVDSAQSVGVPYGGPAPESGQRYAWRVRVWTGDGASSAWSEAGTWEMGLLSPADWQGAEWISPRAATDAATWTDYRLDVDFTIAEGAAGVVFRAQDPLDFYMWQVLVDEAGEPVLRPHLQLGGSWYVLDEVPLGSVIEAAEAHATHHLRIVAEGPMIVTQIDGETVDERENSTFAAGGVGFRSGGPTEDASFDNLEVHDLGGGTLFSDDFSTAPDPAFPGADLASGSLHVSDDLRLISSAPSVPLLRRAFSLDQPAANVASARIYAYGLGFYELRLSGAKVGDRALTPPATEFGKRLRYQTYDVTAKLRGGSGSDVLGLTLAEGYGPGFSQYGWRWLGPRQALVLLDVTYENGAHQRVVSDPSWRWSEGPVRAASIYAGETYDSRLEPRGWDEPGFDDSAWQPVEDVAAPGGELEADTLPPVKVVRTVKPVALTEPEPGLFVFDLGEDIAGRARIHVQGPEGTTVRMRYAENLAADGTLDTFTNGRAASTDTFVLSGGGEPETYEPTFTYHGFRYVAVTGLPSPPTLESLEGRVVHADLEPTSSFSSSDPTLDRIYADNRRTMENNAMSYPTDNPVRGERTGPGLDVHAYADAAVRDFAADRFFAAYLDEIAGDWGGSPDMHDAQVPVAWALYMQYGDRGALESHFEEMAHSIDSYESETEGTDVWPEPGPSHGGGFGDWCPPAPAAEAAGGLGGPEVGGYDACFSEVSLVNTALAYRNALIVARAAHVLGRAADGAHYEAVAGEIAAAFEAAFANGDGYGSGRQVTSVLPLAFGLVPAARRRAVGEALVDRIREVDDEHLDTGIFGTRFLLDALVAAGRPDVAVSVLDQTSYPGFGYEIGQGATTDWEEWTYKSGMESHDHAMFAGINASFLTRLAGIEPLSPGYAEFRIAPVMPDNLERASASLQSVRGEISSQWRRDDEGLEDLEVTVPANAVARVEVPTKPGFSVLESGGPAANSPGVSFLAEGEGVTEYRVGSGDYRFTERPEPPAPAEPPGGGNEPGPREGDGGAPRLEPPSQGARRARLRGRARALPHHRLALRIACLRDCPSRAKRLRVVVQRRAKRHAVLARGTMRFAGKRGHLTLRVHVDIPRRVRVLVRGLRGGPYVLVAPVAHTRARAETGAGGSS